MSSGILYDTKERVRQAIDMVELVGSYVQLRREGRNYKALCPWHDDKRPSLQVNAERQSFKCWVCNIGGDIFSFMMKMENVEFPEALAMLAERAGIPLKVQRPAAGAADTDEKRSLYQAMAWACERFHECLLKAPEAESARRYLAGRHVSDDSIRRFKLGCSPDRWDWLLKQAISTNFSPQILENVGLIIRRQDGPGHYDRFRGRVLFPIHDVQGRPVAIGGRILPQENADASEAAGGEHQAKYVNSPETPLFSKSSMLYALDSARETMAQSRVAIVMEGYTDTIIARQHGFENTVAVLGTALGERHIRLLRRFADSITLVLDGDEAGQRRANEILSLFVAQQVDLRIVTLPDGLDPADFLIERGVEAFDKLLKNAVDAMEHKLAAVNRRIGNRPTMHEINQVLEEILAVLAVAPRLQSSTTAMSRLREHQVLSRLSRQYAVSEEELRARMRDLRQRAKSRGEVPSDEGPAPPPLVAWERELLEVVLLEPEAVPEISDLIAAEQLESPAARLIFTRCCELSASGVAPEFDRLLLEFDQPALKNVLVDLDEQGQAKRTIESGQRLADLLSSLKRRRQHQAIEEHSRVLRDTRLTDDEELALLGQLIEQERMRQGISSPTEG